MDDYGSRVDAQIRQYEFVENMHELPPSFHHFSGQHIAPRVKEVFGVDSIQGVFVAGLTQGRPTDRPYRFLSVGSGDAWLEIEIAQTLCQLGYTDFVFECAEISPTMNDRAATRIRESGLGRHFLLQQVDINSWVAEGLFDGAMAHHSLHHIVELEHVFLNLKRVLKPDANFCVADMIGRNGHMRWPEVLHYVELLWGFLGEEKKRNHQLKRVEEQFVNWDCSHEGFEGIRAQDILPLMLGFFSFRAFTAWGGLIEVFFDRGFGWNFDMAVPADRAFQDFIVQLNDDLLASGKIKPTQMLGWLTASQLQDPPRLYGGLSPVDAVRWP